MSTSDDGQYDLTDSGFDGFMSRSVDGSPAINLDSPTPPQNSVAFDRTQVTGPLGDSFVIGNITLDGSAGTIILNDGTNDRLLIGDGDF